MKYGLFIIGLFLLSPFGFSQTVFFEGFDEADNSTSGTDNSGAGINWSVTCATCVPPNDWFNVESNQLEGRDTNGPAVFTTDDIDVSSCIGLEISFDTEEDSDMEDCIECGGTGVNCVDWVKLEYNLDGGGWTEVAGSSCDVTMTSAVGEMIYLGDLTPDGGPQSYNSPCIDFGTTLQIRISCQAWAGAERWRFDNISVDCNDCVLPVKLTSFHVEDLGSEVGLFWETASEINNDFFRVERSLTGANWTPIGQLEGAGNSSILMNYEFHDKDLLTAGIYYYRIVQVDMDGKENFSKIKSIRIQRSGVSYSNGQLWINQEDGQSSSFTLNIYDLGGKLIFSEKMENEPAIPWTQQGFFLLDIPELGVRQKIVVP